MKRIVSLFILCMACVFMQKVSAQNIIQQVIIPNNSTNSNANVNVNDDIGGVDFRRVVAYTNANNSARYYFEFQNFHSFAVTVQWKASVSSEKYSHHLSYGDVKTGTMVIPANGTKRTNETFSYNYDMEYIKVRRVD